MKTDSDQRIAEKILQVADLENKQVLEIGCGDGRITSLMVGKPKQLTAIEPDAEKIREARKKVSGADFRIGSGENLKFPDKCFDLVIFTLSLHHQNSKLAIREAGRVVKDSCNILIIEPVNEGEVERIFAFLRNEDQATLEVQKSISESGLNLEHSEVFHAKWIFENKQDLYQSLFEYYDMSFDADTVLQISDLMGAKLDTCPIVLQDIMIIQSLKKY
ncbi:class I SAM-dependent methyltransferase [Desulfonema magnum]|uniref:SAM-dependent DNA methylase n=1 Tax=Desulfonema magnum TaxID=45655 RepID=A0A975GQN5_9BACT|nr:class I SAM-dependent methyltransferase [Desulfonema magnum]QTA90090.1 SAM-dependent DNA methylase [Desulfonema magnum]